MAGAVESVHRYTITVPASTRAATQDLTGDGITTANSIPFVTKRISTAETGAEKHSGFQPDVWFSDSTTITVERDVATSDSVLTVEVTVVEFDGARVDVDTGTFQLTSGGANDFTVTAAIGTALDTGWATSAFMVFHSYQHSDDIAYSSSLIRGRITAADTLTFDRGDNGGTADGHWFVAQALSGDFTVEALDIQLSAVASANGTIGAVDMGKTFLVGSWKSDDTTTQRNDHNTCDISLTTTTNINVQRASATGVIDWSGFAIKTTDGTKVQRATISAETGSPMPINVTLSPAIVDARSMAISPGNMGSTCVGSFPSAVSDTGDLMDGMSGMKLTTTTNLQIEHLTNGGEADNDISWEVIEWGTGGAGTAPRRVMVR